MTRLSDSDLQKGFRLANAIHPDRAVALCVLWDACERVALLENLQRRRHGYKLHTPAEGRLQLSIYLASENWERDQESECPRKEPRYSPTSDDRIIRYVKALARNSMDWHSQYGAVAIGCLLYQYAPHQISELAEDVFKSDNIRRVKSTMSKLLKKRFGFMNGNGEVPFVIPTTHQRSLIHRSLAVVAPWAACPAAVPPVPLLETHFANSSQKSEWERLHVLFHPACGGFPQLVREHNSTFKKGNKMRLEEPEDKLGCPQFGTDFARPPDDDNNPPDRFSPSPLTREEISTIRHSVERNEKRRNKYHESTLRVVVDGEETARFAHNVRPEPFAIPSTASCIEIFGDDEEGDLLLAVFPLAPEGTDSNTFEQQVCVEGGQRIELSISLAPKCDSPKSDNIAYNRVWLRYTALSGLPITTSAPDSVAAERRDRLPSVLIVGSGGMTSRYLIEGLLGCGSVGGIYLAQDQRNNTPVVINVIDSPSDESATKRQLRSRFLKEINGLKQLEHPNVARIFDVGTLVDGREYVVMESVSGVNLRTEITSKGMEVSEVVDLTRQLSEAIATLHEHSILHRDIRPENILIEHVDDGMRVKLCDFGLIKEINFESVSPTRGSMSAKAERLFRIPTIGSATYMAPEVLMGGAASIQSDIYALAAVLYEVITGRVPFRAKSFAELLELKQTANPNPCDLRPDFPWKARDIISRALMANPRERYASAKEMGDAIASMLAANEIKRQNTLDRKWRKRNHASTGAAQSRVGFVELLRDILFERRPIEALIMHERFNVLLKRICAGFRTDDTYLSQEELYQEVCLRLLRFSDAFKEICATNEREFFGWLQVVTRNVFFDSVRHARVDHTIATTDQKLKSYDPIPQVEERDLTERFNKFVHSLPENHQKAFELWMTGYNSREIAEILRSDGIQCSHVTVNSWISKAMKRFQEQFKIPIVKRPETRSSS